VSNIVKPAANTGKENINKNPVTIIDQTNNDKLNQRDSILDTLILNTFVKIVVLNFNDPKIDLNPAICKEKIARSTPWPSWAIFPLKGG